MASSCTIAETAPPLATMEAKMIVATGRDHCQQLKDVVSMEDPSSMVVVITSSKKTSTCSCSPPFMDPGLLAVACSGSWKKLHSFLKGDPTSRIPYKLQRCCCFSWMKRQSVPPAEARPTSSDGTIQCCCFLWKKRQSFPPAEPGPTPGDGTTRRSSIQQPPQDEEAQIRQAFLDGVTVEGDNFLHVMATNCIGEDFVEDDLIRGKAVEYLFKENEKNKDTPLHCAARAGKYKMVSILVKLARDSGANTLKALLEAKNLSGWTVLHEAVHVGSNEMVTLLMTEDPQLATIPEDGTSPMYLAILLEHKVIAETLHAMSGGVLSYSGPDRQNALHAAVLRGKDLTEMLLRWNYALTIQQDKDGSTPLHLAASVLPQGKRLVRRERRAIQLLLLEANEDQLYQPDNDGLFPIHVAASMDARVAIRDFVMRSPRCAGLRDGSGKTFLHAAVDEWKKSTVISACMNQSLSWIWNIKDNDGNTALHLAVQKGSLIMFLALFKNGKVQLNLTNKKGETPLDISCQNIQEKGELYYNQNSEVRIHTALETVGAKRGISRQDYLEEKDIVQTRKDQIRLTEMLKDNTQNLCIGSVLIATVTFGATFAMPGGYRADDHTNGGAQTLAGRYAFDAFILANALAFAFSTMATVGLMSSGSPVYNLRSRVVHLGMAFNFMLISVTSLIVAFALGTYVMLAPVAHKVAITVCVLSSLILLYAKMDVAIKNAMVGPAILWRSRKWPNVLTFPLSVLLFMAAILFNLWPIVVIFELTALRYTDHKVEPAAQPPTPLA